MHKAANWLFWKLHGTKINSLIESKCQLIVSQIEGLENLNFKFRGKEFKFTKTGVSNPTNQ